MVRQLVHEEPFCAVKHNYKEKRLFPRYNLLFDLVFWSDLIDLTISSNLAAIVLMTSIDELNFASASFFISTIVDASLSMLLVALLNAATASLNC
jgi:hypothetical protein